MLRSFTIQNFKCLRHVTVKLEPFTVLIGPNDSGKSSILDALRLIGQTFVRPLSEVFTGQNRAGALTWQQEVAADVRWQLLFERGNESFVYKYSMPSGAERGVSGRGGFFERGHDPRNLLEPRLSLEYDSEGGVPFAHQSSSAETLLRSILAEKAQTGLEFRREIEPFTTVFADIPRYRLDPDALRQAAVPQPDAVLSSSGDNLVGVLDRLISGPDRSAIVNLERELHAAIPTLRGIALRTADGKTGAKSLEFVLAGSRKSPVTIPCAHASDGAMLLTAFLALAYSEQPGVLLIEEPENGLHPSRLKAVVEMLRKLSTGEVGTQPRQVILTTHSPLLLNFARPEEVRIVRRDTEKGTQVTPLKAVPDIDKLLAEFGVGELWYLLGEDALVEGKKP